MSTATPTPSAEATKKDAVASTTVDGAKPFGDVTSDVVANGGFFFKDWLTPEMYVTFPVKKVLFAEDTPFQKVQIVETGPFGKALFIDGRQQSALADEFIYHESLVHPALLSHPNPKKVFIGGGGELATAKESLRHASVEKCVMCDIDEKIVQICGKLMPEWAGSSLSDKRLELHHDDARKCLREYNDKFDVIIMDICDPMEGGPGSLLYTTEFYEIVKSKLNPGGVFVTNSAACDMPSAKQCFTVVHNTMKQVFPSVHASTAHIPSFNALWGWQMGYDSSAESKSAASAHALHPSNILNWTAGDIDAAIAKRITGCDKKSLLRFYDGISHKGLYGVPKWLRTCCEDEQQYLVDGKDEAKTVTKSTSSASATSTASSSAATTKI